MTKNEKLISELTIGLNLIKGCELDSRFKMRACLITLAGLLARLIAEVEAER